MKPKKKDLESELIDDLLGDNTAQETPMSEKTEKLGESKILPSRSASLNLATSTQQTQASARTSVGRFAAHGGAGSQSVAGASLVQSENFRIAQQKILDLETETERLRRENEALAAAGETIRKTADELKAEHETSRRRLEQLKETYSQEKEILSASLSGKDRELKEWKSKVEEYEMRLSSNLQKIRVRERELENRLELVRMESTAVVRSKDEILLDLKRRLDQSQIELENYRQKSQEVHKSMTEKQELLRRTVKALRLALSMLENEVDGQDPSKR
jgi:chromosome segregation ATPase